MLEKKEFAGWPSGDSRPIILLSYEPNEIQEKYDLEFFREKDDLGWFEGSHFYDENLGPVVFMRYKDSPTDGTVIYIDSGLDFVKSYDILIKILDLSEESIAWKSEFVVMK